MEKEVIDVPGISEHLRKEGIPLSAAVRGGGFVFVSGQPPVDRRSGTIPLVDIKQQTKLVLDNVAACLEAAGSSLDKVLKCTVYITNAAYFDEVNEVYRQYFRRDPPARVFCTVGSWPKKFDVEIECVALA